MSSEVDEYTQKLLDRTRARNEALQQKMQEHSFQARKRRPLEAQDNIIDEPSTQTTKVDDSAILLETESPNKRCRIENANVVVTSEAAVIQSKPTGERSVSERMQRLLNQRKQWDAADQGQDVDFTNVPSPVCHDPKSPVPGTANSRKVDIERKARFTALAEKVGSWEDDLTRINVPSSSPEKPKVQWKPPTGAGRKTPMSNAYQAQILSNDGGAETATPSADENSKPVKNVSKRVSLSIETLSQFACKEKKVAESDSSTPVKVNVQAKLSADKITVGSCNRPGPSISHQVTPTTKSLQERLVELQRNGCQAEQATGVDKAIAERQEELNQLRQRNSIEIEEQHTDELNENISDDSCMAVTNPITVENEDSFVENEESSTSLNKSESTSIVSDVDESTISYGDSMMEDLDENALSGLWIVTIGTQCDMDESAYSPNNSTVNSIERNLLGLTVDDIEDSVNEDASSIQEKEDQMIDDLFDGVELDDEDSILDPPLTSDVSLIDIPSLTRQKSRQEIRSQLTVCKQTYHEAEDTHIIQRNPSRRLRPLARSNSTESVVSLGSEKPTEQSIPMFTIDSYRTEKRKSLRKVEKKIVRKESVKTTPNGKAKKPLATSLKEQNSKLLEEVQQQQRVIQQASAALNCCYDAHHGKGSITELEAEKLLLIASEKRLALLAEIQSLKLPKPKQDPTNGVVPCRGTLMVDHIQLPLRTEYIFSMASKKDGGEIRSHYYFILVRCGAHKIYATHLASTHDSLSADSLVFKDKFKLDNLESDFDICIEVYSVNHRTRADGVPNQEKSKRKISGIIQKTTNVDMRKKLEDAFEKTKAKVKQVRSTTSYTLPRSHKPSLLKSLTPRKHKSRSSHAMMSHTASPGGPNAIRISSFTLIGSSSVKLGDVKKNKFVLQKVPFLSPISGHLACRVTTNFQSNVEQSGFLTMFDDVGGLGAWHRRWCALREGVLYSWTYPDDEKHKEALSKLEIRECISRDIRTVERIMCARPNTFELRTMRPRRQGDKENLISRDTGSVITTKHWLAADTKDERVAWISSLNQALSDVRAWDPAALKPLS